MDESGNIEKKSGQEEETNAVHEEWKSIHVLDNDQFRYGLVSNVLELQSFFESLIADRRIQNDHCTLAKLDDLLHMSKLQEMQHAIERLHGTLESARFRLLLMIKRSQKFVERLIKSLRQLQQVAYRTEDQLKGVREKRSELIAQNEKTLKPERQKRAQRAKHFQEILATTMSDKLLQGRPVNIYGVGAIQ